jgi:acylphosphatase
MIRRRVRAHGSVQGVFFRDATRREANRRGVAGWAKNCADGSVEAVFEGEPDVVDALVAFTRNGPGHARVERLEVSEETPEGLTGFETR